MHTAARAALGVARAPVPEQAPSEKSQGVWGTASPSDGRLGGHEKDAQQQLIHRLGLPLIRQVLADFRQGTLRWPEAAARLGVSRSQFYRLYADYLRAGAHSGPEAWSPGVSGGDHAAAWPPAVEALLRQRLGTRPPASYSFAASEALRLHGFRLDRAQVRRWAQAHGLAHPRPPRRPAAPVLRWQRSRVGELWQLDATPHRWFPGSPHPFPMLNLVDDCSRLLTGSRIYERENLLAYLDFLPAAFAEYGLPLELYVDYHSLFFTHAPESLTQLGQALQFYGVSFRYAPTPRAKGKVERIHLFWQGRLPAYFAGEHITDPAAAEPHVQALRRHRNQHEVHRELQRTPQQAWDQALQEKRSVLRPKPACPWWPYVWSVRTTVKVGPDGRVPVGPQRLRVEAAPGTKVILCQHPTGHHSVLAAPPDPTLKPVLLFSSLPR